MESYPFDDVTPEPVGSGVPGESAPASPTASRVRKIATGAAIGVAVLATGGVAIAATHTGSTTSQGGPGGGGFGGPGGNSESGGTGQGGPGGGFGGGAPTGSGAAGSGNTPTGTRPTGTPPSGAPTTSGTTGNATGTTTTPQTGNARRRPGGTGGAGSLADALHGTFVVPATSGTGTTTEDLQTGTVTAVSATSISVTSTDKTVGTFVVASTTKVNQGQSKIGDVKVGDTVTVIATDTGKSALTIDDRSLATATNGPGGFGGGMPAGTPPSGAPATQGGEST